MGWASVVKSWLHWSSVRPAQLFFCLSLEPGQLFQTFRGEITALFLKPLRGPVVTVLGSDLLAEPMVAHRQAEKVEGVRFPVARSEASFQNANAFFELAVAVEGHAPRVEVKGHFGR